MTEEEPQSADFFLGKLSGQVKELIHTIGQIGQKVEFLGQSAVRTNLMHDDIKDLKSAITKLEASENRREGATNTLRWLITSPVIPWIAFAGVVGWIALGASK